MKSVTYDYRKKKGICCRCGKQKAVTGKVMCEECAEEKRQYSRDYRKMLNDRHICITCRKTMPEDYEGYLSCMECRQRVAKYSNQRYHMMKEKMK